MNSSTEPISQSEDQMKYLMEDMNWRAIMENINSRIKDQEITKGSTTVLYYTILTLGLISVLTLIFTPTYFVPFILALLPSVFLLCYVTYGIKDKTISSSLICEFLWAGGILSIIFGFFMELTAMTLSYSIQSCNSDTEHPSLLCDGFFIITMVVAVGFTEELAKVLPIARVAVKKEAIMHRVRWWHRYVDNPSHLVVLGVSGGLGFATIENIKYVFMLKSIDPHMPVSKMISTAAMRGVISVPLHFACTGIAVSCVALKVFQFQDNRLKTSTLTFSQLAGALSLPSLFHGIFDSFIILSLKTPPQLTPEGAIMANLPKFTTVGVHYTESNVSFMNPQQIAESLDDLHRYAVIWSNTCIIIAISSYALSLGFFHMFWMKVLKLEAQAISSIERNRLDCPLNPHAAESRERHTVEQPLLI